MRAWIRLHPLTFAFALLAVMRAAAVIGLSLHLHRQGFDEPFADLTMRSALHMGVTMMLGFLCQAAYARTGARAFVALGVGVLLFCTIWTIADPIVFALAGDHLTPSLVSHFVGPKMFMSDYIWRPLAAHGHYVVAGLGVIGVVVFACARLFRLASLPEHVPSSAHLRKLVAASFALTIVPLIAQGKDVEPTPEVLYVVDALKLGRHIEEPRDVEALRAFVGLPRGARWLSARYPLVHAPAATQLRPQSPPDIFVINIESLRGQDMRWVTGDAEDLALPALEGLASRAVVFPHFISNGFPSTEGFICTAASVWPHDRRRIVLDFKHVQLDMLAARLKSRGYYTVHVEDDPDFDEEGFWVRKAFSRSVTFVDRRIYPSEHNMVREIAELLDAHDAQASPAPLFIEMKTAHPHMPYEIPDDVSRRDVDLGSADRNYPVSLRYVDDAIGELVQVLERRARWADTIIIVLGDHANSRHRSHATPLPVDETVWTGALIAGMSNRIGLAHRDARHASQVDIMPTVLALAGDTRPTAALGRDLLSPELLRTEHAIAIRPGGLRLDQDGRTLIVDRRQLGGVFVRRAFTEEPAAPASIRGATLARLLDTWGQLVEQNRIWDSSFLEP